MASGRPSGTLPEALNPFTKGVKNPKNFQVTSHLFNKNMCGNKLK